ncbi:DUF1684 domain-containing protein [Saxibacter everestensis]|uniref:DUF1684 domain-containing protein n=1 Tax=Saxibacter everestensis TaxID=2909229 RepID=A0ABY8QS84_9MICO|nr:DUF1684 domain-containing protein [Brevibacteriaceae bacterium ZFBP1038]
MSVTSSSTAGLVSDWEEWHARREADLSVPYGWLSLTSFRWLSESAEPIAGFPGLWRTDGERAVFSASAGDAVVQLRRGSAESAEAAGAAGAGSAGSAAADPSGADRPVDGELSIAVPEGGSVNWLSAPAAVGAQPVVAEVARRGGRYAIRLRDPQAATRVNFAGVPAFDVNPDWIVTGRFQPYPESRPVGTGTSRGDLNTEAATVGTVEFELNGTSHALIATGTAESGLTLSFYDRSNGNSTAEWRFVGIGVPNPDGEVLIDFNRSINFPFSFTPYGTCPRPVASNVLPIAVTAGEKEARTGDRQQNGTP